MERILLCFLHFLFIKVCDTSCGKSAHRLARKSCNLRKSDNLFILGSDSLLQSLHRKLKFVQLHFSLVPFFFSSLDLPFPLFLRLAVLSKEPLKPLFSIHLKLKRLLRFVLSISAFSRQGVHLVVHFEKFSLHLL